jgi:hypothetical protein
MSQGINPLFALMGNLPPSSQIKTSELPDEYPETIGGMYSDNIITPDQVKSLYYEQVIKGHITQPTPFSEAFLNPNNMEYIRQKIENNIRNYLGEDNVRFLLTREFAQTVIDYVRDNMALSHDVKYGVAVLNDMIIHHETEIALLSQRQNRRYERWALNNDRIRVMPYGIGDKTLHAHGENQVSPAGYELNHPYQSQHKAFLRDVLRIQCPSNSSAPCRIPPFPIRFGDP